MKFPKLIFKSKIKKEIDKEVQRACKRKNKEFEKKIAIIEKQNSIENRQTDLKHKKEINTIIDSFEKKLQDLAIEKDNEILSLENENEKLYKWINKMQDTYRDYKFKINDNEKRAEKLNVFVDNLLNTAAKQHQTLMVLKRDLEQEIKEDFKKEEDNPLNNINF